MSAPQFCLITGSECALCEDAMAILEAMSTEHDFGLVDVKSDTNLYHHYGAFIPVLLNTKTNVALYWPFTTEQVAEFLQESDVTN
ncbi:MAG: glutaredoxin family protein [Glaciecola sp.]|jgi:hypothetical protein